MVLDPLAQASEAGVCGIIGIVVDPPGRAMAEQYVRGREAARQPCGLRLRELVGAVPVSNASLEAGEAPLADL
jgi:hypothetical protein